MSRLIVTNVETQNIKFDSDTTAFTIASDGTTTGTGANKTVILANDTTGGTTLSEIEFDLSMDTSYIYQRFIIENVYASATQDLLLRTRRASDNTYFTGSNSYAYAYIYATSAGVGGSGNNGQTYGRIVGHGLGNASNETSTFYIDVNNNALSGTGKYTKFTIARVGWHSTPHMVSEFNTCLEQATTTTNRFKLYTASGTISYSGYTHLGFKRS
tara:strand:- start:642 stop:1283 length:642 start_codon:yes stop_codon:yes gene_type:complete